MKQKVKKTAKYLLFFSIGVFLFWYLYKDQDISRMKSILTNDVNYAWIWLSVFLGVLSHISRAARWRYLIEPLGHKPRLSNTFFAVMIGYIMNLVLPRMGELSKCGVMSKYEKISFARLIGTMITERIFDLLVLGMVTILMVITQFGHVIQFLNENPDIREKLKSLAFSPYLISGLVILLVLIIVLWRKIKKSTLFRKIETIASHFKEGILSVRYIKNKGAFIFHSLFIWLMYYLMLYVSFFAFDFTKDLSPLAGLTTFVMGSFGMVAPVQGGIGAWHFMTRESLALYGIPYENGIIFAFVAHTIMTLLVIILGLISVVALPFFNSQKRAQDPGNK
ncbi:MAG TPA: TIGR00374 family protein [Prolixibacteraceae bacterium]|nr:TIGR00374 family protein [Prolixibacteraceae bacterium]